MYVLKIILSFIIIGGGFVYLFTCLIAFSGHFRSHEKLEDHTPTVSVIIGARNEEKNIGSLLYDLMKQDYPSERIEIVVIDDCSDDNTRGIVEGFIEKDKRIHLADTQHSQSPYSHKKRAVHEGILSSSGEIIMTTDADCCIPGSWIRNMVKFFTPCVDLVAGEVIVEGGGITGWLEALESTGMQVMAAGLMNAGFPVTCNGANLAYRRTAFYRVGGFEGVGRMVSGDDDLLMQKIAREQPSRVIFVSGRETAVYSHASKSPGEFFIRRARWASKISGYPSRGAVVLLSFFFAFFAAIPLWLVLTLAGVFSSGILIAGFGMKLAGDILLVLYGLIKIGCLKLMLLLPLAEVLHIPYIIVVTPKGFFGSFEWRGRQTKAISHKRGEIVND